MVNVLSAESRKYLQTHDPQNSCDFSLSVHIGWQGHKTMYFEEQAKKVS